MRKLPAQVFSHLGPVPVHLAREIKGPEFVLGMCVYPTREVVILSDVHEMQRWQTLGHEIMHLCLWDAGAHQSLTAKQQEIVCDAFGTWFAAATKANMITMGGKVQLPLPPQKADVVANATGTGRQRSGDRKRRRRSTGR